eukprot:Skav222700  [mRNA]  locus=scaffold402:413486:420773:+ [translate_table: standard]
MAGCCEDRQLSGDLKSEGSSTVSQADRKIHLSLDGDWGGLWLGIRDGFEVASPETSPSQGSGWCQPSLEQPADLLLPPELPSAVPLDDLSASWSPAGSSLPQSPGDGDLETSGGTTRAVPMIVAPSLDGAAPPVEWQPSSRSAKRAAEILATQRCTTPHMEAGTGPPALMCP